MEQSKEKCFTGLQIVACNYFKFFVIKKTKTNQWLSCIYIYIYYILAISC